MSSMTIRDRAASNPRRRRHVRPALEGLEDRMLLYAVTGDHFQFGSRITWSLMPDGTNLGGIPSNFFGTMDAKFGPGNWEKSIDEAFGQWENVANVNFSQVLDDGEPFGAGPDQQGNPNFGDIRIGGMTQASNILAFAMLPPGANGGSNSGDILLNTNQPWNLASNYDLETVMIHEIGHALGVGHTTDPTAVMYPSYGGIQDALGADDIAAVDSIWGPRQYDPFITNFNNLTMANAASINGWLNASNYQVSLPGLNLINSAETEWFKVTTPANASNVLTAQVQSTNLSMLSPRVQIYNAAGTGLVQACAPTGVYGATVNATISNATQNTTYYIKVLASNAGDTGSGGYALNVNMGFQATVASPPPITTVLARPDQGGGNDLQTDDGIGAVIRELGIAGVNLGLQPGNKQDIASIATSLQSVAAGLATSYDLNNDALDAALTSLLQNVPPDVLQVINSLSTVSAQTQGNGNKGVKLNGKLEDSFSSFVTQLQSLLASEPAPGTGQS